MNIYTDKTAGNKSMANTNRPTKTQNGVQSPFQLADNSKQTKQLKSYQTMADNFTSQTVQRKENTEKETAQRMEEEEPLQGKFETTQRMEEEEEPLQGKFETAQRVEEEELLQGQFETAQRKESHTTTAQLVSPKPNNTGLPDNLKSGMESLSGMNLDHVKTHYNSPKPATVQAHAYAQGSDIHLAAGQEQHLPHELAHVVQQAQGRVQATTAVNGMPVNDNAGLENEADVMGAQALRN